MNTINSIEKELAPMRETLENHPMYELLRNVSDVKVFMEHHVFAVWDFMSLLKALQQNLTCTQVPWIPAPDAELSRFINDIVLGEESDVNEKGVPRSHFEMYLEAMEELGADIHPINNFMEAIQNGTPVKNAIKTFIPWPEVQNFVTYTFEIIETGELHQIAAVFTFGREDIIPDMFEGIIEGSGMRTDQNKFLYYLKRHIELDGDEHGPLSLRMIEKLCGTDVKKWEEALLVSKKALKKRITLWDGVSRSLEKKVLEKGAYTS
ncbi:DUF3050 domain-containing protein [Ascidiimonas aurantiaca]|uniref:DUF3050 domain-containing protein n=1 Tax=Ascidiimonas aurantiaca TaxID=1685432 RepID=UPI0030EDBB70